MKVRVLILKQLKQVLFKVLVILLMLGALKRNLQNICMIVED